MRKVSDPEWSEFNDPELAAWRRARAVVEHENTLTNHRLTWLFSSQTLLYAAFGVVFQMNITKPVREGVEHQVTIVLGAIALLGIGVCLYLYHGVRSARRHLHLTDNWYHGETDPVRRARDPVQNYPERAAARAVRERRNPPLQGEGRGNWMDYFHVMYIPVLFMGVWIVLLAAVVFDVFGKQSDWIQQHGLTAVLVVGVGSIGLFLGYYWASRNRP